MPSWSSLSQTECDALLKTLPVLCDAAKTSLAQSTFAANYFRSRYMTGKRREADAVVKLRTASDAELLQWAVEQTVDAGPDLKRGPT